jgi:RHS repeat-associated protein
MPRIGTPPTAYDTHHTHRGDVIVTRSGTSTTGTYDYTAFGNLQAQTGTDICRFKFSSKERDASTGFSYYGYRFYAPQWQRWVSRDPIGETGGMNLYGFVDQDPVSEVDPLGANKEKPPSTDGWKELTDLLKAMKEAWDAAKNGKCPKDPCKAPTSLNAICTCLWDAFKRGKVEDMIQCVCQASPDPECERKARKSLESVGIK